MKNLLQSGIRRIRRIFPEKRQKTGYSSLDVQFRTAYGKQENPRKKRLPTGSLTKILRRRPQINEDGYRRKEAKKIPGIPLATGLVLTAAIVLLLWYNGGWAGWRNLAPDISFFQLHQLEFKGCSVATEAALREKGGLTLYQTNILTLDIDKVEKLLVTVPWVRSAKVTRNWPSGLTVTIVEHSPLALVNGEKDGKPVLSYLDKSGVAFMPVEPGQDIDYPIVTGLENIREPQRRQEIFSDISQFLRQTEKNNPNLPTQAVSEIHVRENGELIIFLVEYPFPIFFGKGQVDKKYNRLVKVLEVLYKKQDTGMQISRVEYIRMDYLNDKVLVAQSGSG